MKPRLLDLFAGAGGAARGYQLAGFEVVGVDINPQPNYCGDDFIQADALTIGALWPLDCLPFDAIHASPPCQAYTLMRHMGKRAGEAAPDLLAETRRLLRESGLPWVIENVVGAPMEKHIVLCGSMFGLGVRRHRVFESSHMLLSPGCNHEPGVWPVAVWGDGRPSRQEARREHRGPIAVYGDHPEDSPIHRAGDSRPGLTRRAATLAVGQEAMGIDWMDWKELTQAIPPAYTELIGYQLMQHIQAVAA